MLLVAYPLTTANLEKLQAPETSTTSELASANEFAKTIDETELKAAV
jgi:hypothetical protein